MLGPRQQMECSTFVSMQKYLNINNNNPNLLKHFLNQRQCYELLFNRIKWTKYMAAFFYKILGTKKKEANLIQQTNQQKQNKNFRNNRKMLEQDQSRRIRHINPVCSPKENLANHKQFATRRRNAISRKRLPTQFKQDLYDKFNKFNKDQSFLKVEKMFHSLIGRHSVIDYSKQFDFKQQWEVVNKQEYKQEFRTSLPYAVLNVILLLIMNCCLWGISAKITFQILQFNWIYYIIASVCVIEIFKNIPKLINLPFGSKLACMFKQLACIGISIVLLVHNFSNTLQTIAFEFTVLILIYLKTRKLYDHVKIFHISSKHRQIVDIIDLFVLLIAISHIFALFLYLTTHLHPDTNWMTRIVMEDHQWITKYIYALYFSSTTLLTVGYGDISPTNVTEILTILLTQLIGIAAFAYAVNKIGVALTNISERTQRLQKDLGNVQHIGNAYELQPQLVCRMRKQLIKDKTLDSELNIRQENELFGKFSEDLREKISIQSSMRVIKRSMFMIGNWTGKMQSKIARKLIKQIYAIDELLPQNPGKQKIYILDKGKVDIINNARCGFKICFQKVLKTLSVQSNNQVVVENVYGYSAVISQRQINLNAVAKSNSICYTLQKSDLFELLQQCEQDLEHFHQLKSKINLSKIPEQAQAPSIRNFREHYCPSVHFIIAQYSYKAGNNKFNETNSRVTAIRTNRKVKIICSAEDVSSKTLGSVQRIEKTNKSCFYFESTVGGRINETLEEVKYDQQIKKEVPVKNITINFEACRDYQRYYKKFNYENVVNKINTRVYSKKSNTNTLMATSSP